LIYFLLTYLTNLKIMHRAEFTALAAPITKAWDSSNPRLYFSAFYNTVLDAAARMTDDPDQIIEAINGMASDGSDHVPPTKPIRPILPEMPTSVTAAANLRSDFQFQMRMYEQDLKCYQEYNAALSAILHAIHDALPAAVQPIIKINNNLREQTPHGAMQILEDQYGSMVNNEIQGQIRELSEPLPMGRSIEAHIARHREIHRTLREHQQGLPVNMQVNMLISTLPSLYNSFLERYNESHPGLDRDFTEFATLLLSTTADKATYGAANAATAPIVDNKLVSTPTLDGIIADIAALKLELPKLKGKKFCKSHGYNFTHNTDKCRGNKRQEKSPKS
jgi:hypothetical protein